MNYPQVVQLFDRTPVELSPNAHGPMIEYSFADLGANPLGDAIEVKNSFIAVPSGPGLRRDPDPEIIKRYSI